MANSEQFCNDPGTTLSAAITSTGATSLTVTSSTGYPSTGNFRIRIDSELMLVTGVSGTTWTVTRGIESTTAAVHSNGALVYHVLTSGALAAIRANQSQVGATASLPSTTVAYQGDSYRCDDSGYEFIYTGSVWQASTTKNLLGQVTVQSTTTH